MRLLTILLVFVSVSAGVAQPVAPVEAPPAPKKPIVAIVGASVSAGYKTTFRDGRLVMGLDVRENLSLRKAVRSFWSRDDVQVESFANSLFFLAAESAGRRQTRLAKKLKPDLVLALDFPFWFAYGNNQRYATTDKAKARFSSGLAMLEGFDCPIIIGDVPHITDANPRMLPPHAVPLASTLESLNEVLREWSSSRPQIRLFGLTEWIKMVKAQGAVVALEQERLPLGADVLFQKDNLHATELGVALLTQRMHGELRRFLPDEDQLRPAEIGYADIVRHLGATQLLKDAAKARSAKVLETSGK